MILQMFYGVGSKEARLATTSNNNNPPPKIMTPSLSPLELMEMEKKGSAKVPLAVPPPTTPTVELAAPPAIQLEQVHLGEDNMEADVIPRGSEDDPASVIPPPVSILKRARPPASSTVPRKRRKSIRFGDMDEVREFTIYEKPKDLVTVSSPTLPQQPATSETGTTAEQSDLGLPIATASTSTSQPTTPPDDPPPNRPDELAPPPPNQSEEEGMSPAVKEMGNWFMEEHGTIHLEKRKHFAQLLPLLKEYLD